tara:strand:+ start:572 stop:847 length:276 start_codon:yes stop_codon:yes gene_type:complete
MRGRQKGQTKRMSIIKDESISPYEIHVEEEQYVLVDGEKQKPLGYFTELNGLINKISRMSLANNKETYTLVGFIESFNNIKNEITNNFKNL